MSSRQDETVVSSGGWLRLAGAMALVVGIILAVALVYQQMDVYFTFGGETVVTTEAEGTRYVWTAGAGIFAMALCLALGLIVSSRPLGRCGFVGIIVVLVLAGVFPVPRDRWQPDPPTYDLPQNYTPCYSGSQECGAGG